MMRVAVGVLMAVGPPVAMVVAVTASGRLAAAVAVAPAKGTVIAMGFMDLSGRRSIDGGACRKWNRHDGWRDQCQSGTEQRHQGSSRGTGHTDHHWAIERN